MHGAANSNDVTIVDLYLTLRENFFFLSFVIVFFMVLGLVVAFTSDVKYKSSVLLAPSGDEGGQSKIASLMGGLGSLASIAGINTGTGMSVEKTIAILKSRQFTHEFLAQNDRLHFLFRDMWDEKSMEWKAPEGNVFSSLKSFVKGDGGRFEGPTYEQTYNRFNEVRAVGFDNTSGLVTLSIELSDPSYAQIWANELVAQLNRHVRKKDIEEAERGIKYLESQIASNSLVEMKKILYALMESKVQTIMLATVRDEYVFKIVDPAVKPEAPSAPRRTVILVGFTIAGVIIGIFLVLIRQMVLLVRKG